jgi:catecholate siderophore receptor
MRIINKKTACASVLLSLAAPLPLFAQVMPKNNTPTDTLPPVVVEDTALTDTGSGYQSTLTSVGKLMQPAKDIPQSLTVVTRDLIDDRNADTLKEALRNVAGLTFNAGEGGRVGDNITIRGFAASSELYLDGVRDNAQYNRETFNLERVEVLRGASSMLFGRGSTGGIVHQVSKEPALNQDSEVEATIGSYEYFRETADINQKISETAAVRLNIMRTDTESFRSSDIENERFGIAPAIKWGIGTDNEFLLSYTHYHYDDTPDYGIPIPGVQGGKPIDVDRGTFYGLPAVDYQQDSVNTYTGRWVHRFDTNTELKTAIRKSDVDRDLRAVAPRVNSGLTSVSRNRQARGANENNITASTDLTKRFQAFGMKHEGLLGTEYVYETADRWNYFSSGALNNPATSLYSPNPFDPLPAGYAATYNRINPLEFTSKNIGIYAQDIVEFIPKWKVLGGVRLDDFKADYKSTTTSSGAITSYTRDDRVVSYRTGLMYQPDDYSTYYVAYGTAFNPSGDVYSIEATQAARSEKTDPEKSINYEIGAKWELFDGDLSMRTALFRTEKTNERNTDPALPDVYLLSGQRHTDGVELELAGRITPEWEVFAALALMTANIDKQLNPFGEGLTPVNTPKYTGSIWSTYKLDPAWKVGGGIDFVGRRTGYTIGTTTPYTPPVIREVSGYARLDGLVEWQVNKGVALKLNLFNLTDQEYYDAIYTSGAHAIPGRGREAQLSVSYKF